MNRGMGMEGSWSGPGGGGYREYYLVKMLMNEFGFNSFLLYGTGNTQTFEILRREGINVTGCDISRDVVEHKKASFGNDTFFTPDTIPPFSKYEAIIAVEVFEHFTEPKSTISFLMNKLDIKKGGIICGTTNFFLDDKIEDKNIPGYMSHKDHVAYWNINSMSAIALESDYAVTTFEMIRPGSVLPDEKYGQLWPNKRVFFMYNPILHSKYFNNLLKTTPILPIDKP